MGRRADEPAARAHHNDWIAKAVAGNPTRFVGLGTLPLHVPPLAVAELERCRRELGLRASRSRPRRERWSWAMARCSRSGPRRRLDALVYIHPGNRDRRFKRFHLWNSVGQAFEEAMAISSLMYDGVLESFPGSGSASRMAAATCRTIWAASTGTTSRKPTPA